MPWYLSLGIAILSSANAVWIAQMTNRNEFLWGVLGFFFGPVPLTYLILVLQNEKEYGKPFPIRKEQ